MFYILNFIGKYTGRIFFSVLLNYIHFCMYSGQRVHLEVPVHEPLAVQEIDSLCNLEEDIQTLVVLPLLREAALSHPVLQVLFPTELHLDVQVHLETGGEGSIHYNSHFKLENNISFEKKKGSLKYSKYIYFSLK